MCVAESKLVASMVCILADVRASHQAAAIALAGRSCGASLRRASLRTSVNQIPCSCVPPL